MKRLCIIPFSLIILLSGCSYKNDNSYTDNQIPSHIGNTNNVQVQKSWNEVDLYDKTEYEYNNDSVSFFTSRMRQMPEGFYKQGDQTHVIILGQLIPDNHSLKLEFTERDADFNVVKVIEDTTYTEHNSMYPITIPKKENAIYTLYVEITSPYGEVIGQNLSLLEVPPEEMNAKLTINKTNFEPTEHLKLSLKNWGPTDLFFGIHYTVERKTLGKWKVMNGDMAFQEMAYGLTPGETFEQEVDLGFMKLGPGSYRIRKTIEAEYTSIIEQVAVEFTVE